MATRTSTSIGPNKKVKAYTNNGTEPVVVTLSLVSETATANPQVSVKIDNSSTRQFDYNIDDSSVSQLINNGFWIGFDGSSITPTFGPSTNVGKCGMNVSKSSGNNYTQGYNNSYPFDPYFILEPSEAGMGADWTYGGFFKNSGSSVYHYSDLSVFTNTDFEDANNGQMPSGQDHSSSISYYDNYLGGTMHCPYYNFVIGFQANSYSTMRYMYTKSSSHNSNRSTNGWIYSTFGGANPQSYRPDADGQNPGASGENGWWWSGSHGIYLFNKSVYSGGDYNLFDTTTVLGESRYAGTDVSVSDIDNLMSSSYVPVHIDFRGGANANEVNYLAHNPWDNKTYIRAVSTSADHDGVVEYTKGSRAAGNASGRVTTGNGNSFKDSAWDDAFTTVSETSSENGISGHTTRPICVGYKLWVCRSGSTRYFSNDLLNWKTIDQFDATAPASYTMINETGTLSNNGEAVRYYGKESTVTKRQVDGWSAVPVSGTLENRTSVGNYERTALVVPAGESLYVNNHDASSSVACNVIAIAL